MALRDDQVLRYSRQLLLREVGGAGQRAWLESGVRVVGHGAGLEVAVAYLAASGVRVAASRESWDAWCGWLEGTSPVALNPDAFAGEPPVRWVCLAEASPGVQLGDGSAHCVLGSAGSEGAARVVLSRCRMCAEAELRALTPLRPGPRALQVGAQAARALQLWLLAPQPSDVRIALAPGGISSLEDGASCRHPT